MENPVLTKLRAGGCVGAMCASLGSPTIAELMVQEGCDAILFDLQHGLWTRPTLEAGIAAVRGKAVPLVRPQDDSYFAIGNALDSGALGLIVPMVESAEQAKRIVAAAKPLLARLVQQSDCIAPQYRKRGPSAYGRYMLHRAPLFNISSVVWGPGDNAKAHNHDTWGMVGVVENDIQETRFRRTDSGARARRADRCRCRQVEPFARHRLEPQADVAAANREVGIDRGGSHPHTRAHGPIDQEADPQRGDDRDWCAGEVNNWWASCAAGARPRRSSCACDVPAVCG